MTVKAVYMIQGIVMGDAVENTDGTVTFTEPVLVIPQQQNMAFMPFLMMMEERSVKIKLADTLYGELFTPVIELRNQYSKMFGAGIIEAGSNVLQL